MSIEWKPVVQETWLPIETAPKDGTEILAVRGKLQCVVSWRGWRMGDGALRDDEARWRSANGYHIVPTHWMSLPEPPAERR